MLSIFELATLLLALSAAFGWLNVRWLALPHTIGLLVMGLGSSLILLLIQQIVPGVDITTSLQSAIGQIDFYGTIMNGLLAFLLFAGALHVDFDALRNEKWPIAFMATAGVVVSTVVVAACLWWAAGLIGIQIPFAWALVFGALISPTDPVAVLSLLKTIDVRESLKAKIAGESLFNDGVAVVAFSLLVAAAVATAGENEHPLSLWHIAELFFHEGVGGALFGLVMGWLAFRAMAAIDDHVVEVLISIAVCALTYALSLRLHVSGPIAVVVAGLLIGNQGVEFAMSEKVRDYMFAFWEIVDEVLNSVLFLLIGLEVLVLTFDAAHIGLMAIAIPVVLVGRLVSVSSPLLLRPMRKSFGVGAIPVLTWGGLRGGVSVALALSLPDSDYKPLLLAATYAVVIFSIVVQGLTVKKLIARVMGPDTA
ncbi:MAG: sodium:proton antiporter [Rhizobiales bacterium]|nr:sodium:proton antiporter [Hyphomicrobiales bacterium]OJU36228.1 MAG: sodium:proton antiporter [Rhizobiales bacterium 68-8]